VSVVIRVTGSEGGLARLPADDYEAVRTRGQIERAIRASPLQTSLELATANDAAAAAVLAVTHGDRGTLLRTDRSETSLSELGTTATLTGQFKH